MPCSFTAWNTKRLYSDKGQRIAARVTKPDGDNSPNTVVLFADVDRMIDGRILIGTYNRGFEYARDLQDFVMFMYDRNMYLHSGYDEQEAIKALYAEAKSLAGV